MTDGNTRPRKWIRRLFGAAIICVLLTIISVAGIVLLYKNTRPALLDLQSIEKPSPTGPVIATWNGVQFRKGSVVRVKSWAGTIKRERTGLDMELSIEAGRLGTVVGATNLVTIYNQQFGGETQVLLIQWFEQEWSCLPIFWRHVQVKSFQSSINPDYLAVEN